jgi:hypothetical protein
VLALAAAPAGAGGAAEPGRPRGVAGVAAGGRLAQAPAGDAELAAVVLEQLEAFRRGDFAAAYGFASAAIQARFPLEAFRRMVTEGYAPIARSTRGTVLRVERVGPARGYVEIRVQGQDGETVDALYELVEEQGAWRVSGVLTRPVEPGTSA